MRVLFLSYDGLTDPLGQSQILPYLTGLAKSGHEIDIVSFEKSARYSEFGSLVDAQCKAVGLGFFPQRYRKHPPILSTLLDIRKMKRMISRLHRQNQYDVIHCRSYIAALAGRWMQKRFGTKFIFDMRGFYADERVDGDIWPRNNWIFRKVYRYFKKKETEFLQNADYTVSLTKNAKKEILRWNVLKDSERMAVIPCCADTDHFSRDQTSESTSEKLRAELKIPSCQPVVGYIGSIGTWYLLDDILHYFQLLLERYPHAVMLFFTYDNPKIIFKTAAKRALGKDKLRIIGVTRSNLPSYMALLDWSVFFIQPVFSKKASSPTKQAELMSMGIPVVCNANVGDTEEIINKYDAGICLADTSEQQLKSAVQATDRLLNADKSKIILGAKQYFSLENGIAEYNRIYAEVMQ